LESIKALHLCANFNLPYLLELGTELVSFDAFQIEVMPRAYARSIAGFLNSGGILSWGIVPTDSDNLDIQTPQSLVNQLTDYWKIISDETGMPLKQIGAQALIAPARCCLKNIGQVSAQDDLKNHKSGLQINLSIEDQVVEKAFGYLRQISEKLQSQFNLT
jgi:hypothetical protein